MPVQSVNTLLLMLPSCQVRISCIVFSAPALRERIRVNEFLLMLNLLFSYDRFDVLNGGNR